MKETLHASSRTPRTAKDVTSQLLKDPETVQDFSDFIGKAVVTSMARPDVQIRAELNRKHDLSTVPSPVLNPSYNMYSRSDRKKRYVK